MTSPWLKERKKSQSAKELSDRAEKSVQEKNRYIFREIYAFDVESFWSEKITPALEKAADEGLQEYILPQRFLDAKLSNFIPKSIPHTCFYNKIIDHAESLGFIVILDKDIWRINFSQPEKKHGPFWSGVIFIYVILIIILICVATIIYAW